jgi:4-carboxymuconolactone decarboxylase
MLVAEGSGTCVIRWRRWAALAFAALAAAGALAQSLPIEDIQLRGDRFKGLHYREMSAEQRALLYNVVNSARAVTNATGNGPFNVLLRSPAVGELSQRLGNTIRFSAGLSGRLREQATLMAGRAWTSAYEWYAHERYARDEGIEPSVIAAIAAHRRPDLGSMPLEDAIVWRVADELLYTRRISDTTYREAVAALGEQRLLATVTIAAYYEYVSMLLNVDRYPLPSDASRTEAAAARALVPLTAAQLRRAAEGSVTPRTAIVHAEIAPALEALGAAVDRDSELPTVVRDIAVDVVMRRWHGDSGHDHPGAMPQADATARFANELLDTRFVSDEAFSSALATLGERGVVNLLVLLGYSNIRCAHQALAGAACELHAVR